MVNEAAYDPIKIWALWMAAVSVALPMAKIKFSKMWLGPNWRHEVSSGIIVGCVLGVLGLVGVAILKGLAVISFGKAVALGALIGAVIGGALWYLNRPDTPDNHGLSVIPANTQKSPAPPSAVFSPAKPFDEQLKDAVLDTSDDVAAAQAARLRENGDEKIAQARALRLDAQLRPAMNHLLDMITETIRKASEGGLIKMGEIAFGLPERTILSLHQARPTQMSPDMAPIVRKVSMGENVEWRIRLDYGYTMTPSQAKERNAGYDFVGPYFYIIEMRRVGNQFQMGNISLDESGKPEAHINNVLPTTRARLMQHYEKLSGDELVRFFILELIKETKTRTDLSNQQ